MANTTKKKAEPKLTTKQVNPTGRGGNRNPTGKGGFQERPEDRSDGRWSAENSISYQYKKLLTMTEKERETWAKGKEGNMTGAEEIAYGRFKAAKKSLLDAREITDRTEGKAPQSVDLTSGGEPIKTALVEFIDVATSQNTDTD